MKTILVTGKSGQLSQALQAAHARFHQMDYRLHAMGRPDLDFTKPETIEQAVLRMKPAIIINTAAYTAVDEAETNLLAATQLNVNAPKVLTHVCAALDIPLIHISTDYVFDGKKGEPYAEIDLPVPLNVYGQSKLAGEKAILTQDIPAIVLRTSWLYSGRAKNFLMTMLTLLAAETAGNPVKLEMVNDQRGRPTSADDLVQAIATIVSHIDTGNHDRGIFHVTGGGEATWYEFAQEIFKVTARYGWKQPELTPITTAQRGAKAQRPADSRLDCTKIKRVFDIELPDWHKTLETTIAQICTRGRFPGKQRNVVASNPIKNHGAVPKSIFPI